MKPLALALILLAGCATRVELSVAGGSKADGIVVMRGDYGMYKSPDIDVQSATPQALSTCRSWGYKGARPLATYQERCVPGAMTPVGCASTEVVVRFQCTG